MNIILLAKSMQRPVKIHLNRAHAIVLFVAVLVVPMVLASYLGFYWGSQYSRNDVTSDMDVASTAQSTTSEAVPRDEQETINALTAKLGVLQAQVLRLNALGKRLVDMAGLEKGEFDFNTLPPQGGPEQPSAMDDQTVPLPSLLSSVDALDLQLEDRQQQLNVLETVFMNRNLLDEVFPAGRPVNDGWISSYFLPSILMKPSQTSFSRRCRGEVLLLAMIEGVSLKCSRVQKILL